MAPPEDRVVALDLVRGVAVLGILTINIAGFSGPLFATLTPHALAPGTFADEAWFAFTLLVFEGKMRALFTILFGASLVLFTDRADAAGRSGERLQLRRLGWLALIGYLHFALLWWGDILFAYALCGFAALALRQAPPRALAVAATGMFAAWHLLLAAQGLPAVLAEEAVRTNRATPEASSAYAAERQTQSAAIALELAGYRQDYATQVRTRLQDEPARPLAAALASLGETLPLILLGMALFRMGLFDGRIPARTLRRLGGGALLVGGGLTAAFVAVAWPRHFPPALMVEALAYGLALPHLLMALGYAALLIAAAPRLARNAPGQRIIAAGRMALSNYLGTSLVMTFVFYGWGLGLVGQISPHGQAPFVLAGWALMLGWSAPWLARFRHGPLEWAWRSLTTGRIAPLRRTDRSA